MPKKLSDIDHANLKVLALVVERERMAIRAAEQALQNTKLTHQMAEANLARFVSDLGAKYGVDVGSAINWETGDFEEQHHEQHSERRTHQSEVRGTGRDRTVASEAAADGSTA